MMSLGEFPTEQELRVMVAEVDQVRNGSRNESRIRSRNASHYASKTIVKNITIKKTLGFLEVSFLNVVKVV